MANLPKFKQLRKEDYPSSPNWMANVFYVINQFFEAVYNALSRNISFRQNIDCQIFDYTFTAEATFSPIEIATTIKRRADGVLVLYCYDNTNRTSVGISAVSWSPINQGISIDSLSGLTTNISYSIRFLII